MSRRQLAWYVAISPEYYYIEPVCEDGTGPCYPARDSCIVEAHTKREARVMAVRHWRSKKAGYLEGAENPFVGVAVHLDTAGPEGWNEDDIVAYTEGKQ